MRVETEDSGFSVAPLIGAAGAAMAIIVATERFAIKRETAAIGGAAIALAVSQATSGTVRALFQGAALAGIGLAIVELVRIFRGGARAGEPSSSVAPSLDADRRSEFEKTVAAAPAPSTPTVSVEAEPAAEFAQKAARAEPSASPSPTAANPVLAARIKNLSASLTLDELLRLNQVATQLSPEQLAHLERELLVRSLDASVELVRTQVIVGTSGHARA
jgi:hypothetical protein